MGSKTVLKRSCALWNRHENSSLISEIGPNGTPISTVTFPSGGKWGNAMYSNADNERVEYNLTFNLNEYMIEGYLNSDWSLVSGSPDDGNSHEMIAVEDAGVGTDYLRLLFHNNPTFDFWLFLNGSSPGARDHTSSFSAGTFQHIAVVVSRSANFDGSKTLAIYLNKVQTASSTEALQDNGVKTVDVYFGTDGGGTLEIDGLIDQPKIYPVSQVTPELVEHVLGNNAFEGFKDHQAILL